jgi:NADPH:quinone reductase-like Zn-dependent oxidoreductase
MKAAVYGKYGPPDVLKIAEVEKPVPGRDEVLVRIHAATVCAGDVRFRKADPFFLRLLNGLLKPKRTKVLGMEFAGTIEAVGGKVARFSPGDRVFGSTGFKFGTYADYACVSQHGLLAVKPPGVPDDDAAAIPFGGISALYFLRRGSIEPGQKVLVYGASGSVGTFAVQLVRRFGAHVTGVCSTANLELIRSLGAEEVIDYTRADFSIAGRVYDIIFDTVGKSGFWRSMKSLKRGGSYVMASSVPAASTMKSLVFGLLSPWLGGMWASLTGAGNVIGGIARGKAQDLSFLMSLIEAGELRTVIDRRYLLDEIAEAHRYVEVGHKKGNVVVAVHQRSR